MPSNSGIDARSENNGRGLNVVQTAVQCRHKRNAESQPPEFPAAPNEILECLLLAGKINTDTAENPQINDNDQRIDPMKSYLLHIRLRLNPIVAIAFERAECLLFLFNE